MFRLFEICRGALGCIPLHLHHEEVFPYHTRDTHRERLSSHSRLIDPIDRKLLVLVLLHPTVKAESGFQEESKKKLVLAKGWSRVKEDVAIQRSSCEVEVESSSHRP